MNFLPGFKNYLFSQKNPSSKITVKNYLSDIIRFLKWLVSKKLSDEGNFDPTLITSQLIELFTKEMSDQLSPASIERNLSSLRKFFNFLVLEGLISESPFKMENYGAEKSKVEPDPWKLKAFKNYLYVYNASPITIKNYLMDIRAFLKWVEEVLKSEKDIFGKIDNNLLEEYKRRLPYAPRTINRKLSSLRKYVKWAEEEGLIEKKYQVASIKYRVSELRTIPNTKYKIHNTAREYSGFPPFRLLQKTFRGLTLLPDLLLINPLASLVRKVQLTSWRVQGKPVFEQNQGKTATRTIKSLPKEVFAPLTVSTAGFSFHRKLLFHLAHTRPNWYRLYHSYSITHYIHLAILIIFTSAIGFGVYQSFFNINPSQKGVLGTNLQPQPNPRVLSFQGKLTDSSGNPITTSTNLRFGIYAASTATGSALIWQEVDKVTPDSDGVFSVLLGQNSSLTQDIFANHAGLWLGVTVGQTPELTPRQQLATVAFAENSETLQGLPPITQTGAATTNVVLALDSSGNLTIGGSATPTFQATGGQFTLSGNTLALTTTAGTNGDIIATPSGLGKIDLNKPIQNTSNNNNITSAKGAVEVDDLFAVLATSSGQSALTVNQNGTGPLISASTSGVRKFTVDNSGNTELNGGNFTQVGTGSFSTGTGAITLNGNTTISSGNNFTVTSGNTSLTSSAATSNALSLTDTSLTSGTGFAKTFTSNAGNGQTTVGESIALTDSTTAGGGYTGLSISTSGSGTGSGNKYLLDLNPGTNKEVVFDNSGAFRPTTAVSSNTNTLGSPSFYWKNIYVDTVTANTLAGSISGSGTSATSWTLGNTQTGDVNEALIFQRNSGSGNATLQWNAGTGDLRYLTANYPLNTTYTVNNTSIGTTIDLLSAALTNNTTSGTQNLLSLTNTGTGTTANGIYINNTGTGTNAIQIAGGWTTGLLTNNTPINAGSGAITGGAITGSSLTDSGLSTAGVVTNSAAGLLSTLAGTTTTVLHGNASGAPTFASISGSDLASNIIISTTGSLTTTGTGTITSAGLLTASNGLTLTTGALNLTSTSGNVDLSGSTGTFKTSTGANTLSGDVTISAGKNLTVTSGTVSITPTNASTVPVTITGATSQSADLLDIKNSLNAILAKIDNLGNLTANTLTSTVAQGTAPLTVTSTTSVANLNAAAAQEPMPNLVLNSDFGRRNKWMTFMPETFTDTNDGMTVLAGSANQSVSANVLTPGTSDGTRWLAQEGLTTWKDARFSGQIKWNSGLAGIGKTSDVNNMVIATIEATAFSIWKRVGGTFTNVSTTTISPTAGNTYWVELEAQGTTYVAKLYSTGGTTYVAKSSATLSNTITATITDAGVASGSFGYWEQKGATENLFGGLSTGDGGVYVEGWGPEGVTPTFQGTKGGQAFGFDESADAGPIGKQWALRAYIPATSRSFTLGYASGSQWTLPSVSLTHSIYVKTSSKGGTGPLVNAEVYQYDNTGSIINAPYNTYEIADAGETSWTRKSITATSDPSTRTTAWQLIFNGNPTTATLSATGTAFVMLGQLEQGAIATPWRNAPTDDDPIVWDDTYNNGYTNILTTNSATKVELESGRLATNIFMPTDGTLDIEVNTQARNDTSGYTPLDLSIDGAMQGNATGLLFVDVQTANKFVPMHLMYTKSLTAGKHRIAVIGWQGNAGTTAYGYTGSIRFFITANRGKSAPSSGANDLAEEYSVTDPTIEAGDVVRISGNQGSLGSASVEKTDKGYDPSAFGVISTAPAITFGNYDPLTGKIIDTSSTRWTTGTDRRPVALKGRVPVKVTNENGPIHRGDTLTSSATYQGYAMKATKAGPSIGIAMEDFAPVDNGTVQTGKIMTFVNLSWYDPDVYLTSTGDFVINKIQNNIAAATPDPQTGLYPNQVTSDKSQVASSSASPTSEPIANCQTTTDSSNFGLVKSNCPQTVSVNYTYQIADSLGNVVQRVGAFSELVVGTLRTGLVQTKELIADQITTYQLQITGKVISPIAEISQVKTDIITPLGSDKIVIKLQNNSATPSATSAPKLEIQNASGSAVAVFDDKGNATLSGQLAVKSASISGELNANDATISGTLRTKNLIADNIDTAILNLKSSLSNLLPKTATPSSVLNNLPETASVSAQLANVDTLQAQVGTFMQGLFVVGPASLSDATVFGQLSIGTNLILADNSINVLGSELKLQPLGQGGILLGKKIEIDSDGNLSVNGDAKFNGTLFAGTISPIPGSDLTFKLLNKNASDSARFKVVNASGSAVATIDSNGDATFRKLNLDLISPAFALSQTEIIATGSAGIATVSAQQKEITIDNKLVTDKSLIYISPVGTPSAQTPFLMRQLPGQSFTVGVGEPDSKGQTFNWLIIN